MLLKLYCAQLQTITLIPKGSSPSSNQSSLVWVPITYLSLEWDARLKKILLIVVMVPGFPREQAKGDTPMIENRRHSYSPCPPLSNQIENSIVHGFELHRPSSKSTKLLLQVKKATINNLVWLVGLTWCQILRHLRVVLIRISKHKHEQVCTSHTECATVWPICDICDGHKLSQIWICDRICFSVFLIKFF